MICQGAAKIGDKKISSANKGISYEINSWNKLYEEFIIAGIVREKPDNFGRISEKSKQAVFCVALALYDSGICLDESRDAIAIIASNRNCCQSDNSVYFKDYVEHGRTSGRGNLFVNTLPTTPGAMAGIACGLHGMLYFCADETSALEEAALVLESGEASKVVAILDEDDILAAFVFSKGESNIDYADLVVENGIADFFESTCKT